jgi:Protein of Unknown function (DUF2784)
VDPATAYRLAADAVLLVHALLVLFVVGLVPLVFLGGPRGWRWVRLRWLRAVHLACIAVIVLQAWLGRLCPLTDWEMALRARAGDATYHGAFVAHWLERCLYYPLPPRLFAVLYSGFALLVLASWWWVPPGPRGGIGRY